jgi:poly(A) polymerase
VSDALGPLPGLDELAVVVTPVAERFRRAGHRIFLVGGVVRDLVVARDRGEPLSGGDIDLTTDARPDVIRELVGPLADVLWDQGERFGTIGARVAGKHLEITTHRAEAYDPESRKPMVSFGDHLGGDLERRDFTINAAAIELPGGELHDPHGGIADLRDRILRTPLSAEISFTDDPLRMLRAARFIPRFELDAAPGLVVAATEMAARLEIVSVERVADEIERLLAVDAPAAGLAFLVRTGLLPHVFPALGAVDAGEVAMAVALAGEGPEPSGGTAAGGDDDRLVLVRRAGLLWPVRHRAGAELGRLRYSRAETTRTVRLLEAVERAVDEATGPPTAAGVRGLAARTGPELLVAVTALAANLVDVGQADSDRVARLTELVDELTRTEDLGDLDGPLSGAEIMDLLGIEPGPDVGRALAHLRELRIAGGPLGPDRARRELLAWWRPGS